MSNDPPVIVICPPPASVPADQAITGTLKLCADCGTEILAAPVSVKKEEQGASLMCLACGVKAMQEAAEPIFGGYASEEDAHTTVEKYLERKNEAETRMLQAMFAEGEALEKDGYSGAEVTDTIICVAESLLAAHNVLAEKQFESLPDEVRAHFKNWTDQVTKTGILPDIPDEVAETVKRWMEDR